MAIASTGLGSGLDVNAIVSQLISLEKQPITVLNQREAGIQAKITTFGTIKGALSNFQSAVRGLSSTSNFLAFKATPGDATVASVSAAPTASVANYNLDVTTLAQAQKLTAVGQASSSTAIGNGILTFDFGTISGGTFDSVTGKYTGAAYASNGGGAKTVTIDNSNNSLQGIRDAINNANIGVSASIVNDGSANAPFRLVLTSANSGQANSLKIGVSGDAALSNLLAQDVAPGGTQNLSQTVAAQNATFKIDGVAISKSTNTITDAISGVTITLLKPAATTTLAVTRDTQTVQNSVQAFVKAYNDVNKVLSDSSAYNAATKKGAILQGDSAVRNIQNQIRGTLTSTLTGLSGNITALNQVGVSFQKDGTLTLDSVKLQSAINGNFTDIAGLFAATGKATDSLVQFAASNTATVPGSYAVAVSRVATQGNSVGVTDISAGVTISGANNTLNVTVDGVAATLTLDSGTYSANTLATQIQSKINGATALSSAGAAVSVAVSGVNLAITSSRYGSGSSVSVTGGTALASVFGAGVNTTGVDVAGSIGGQTATGAGQSLTGTGDAAGLRLNIIGGSTGSRGTLNYAQGYAYKLDQLVNNFTGTGGVVSARTDGLSKSVTDIGTQRDALTLRINNLEVRLRAQFNALDTQISKFTATGSFLTQQLAKLPGFTR